MPTARRKTAAEPTTAGPVRVVYDALPAGTETWVYDENRDINVPTARHPEGETYKVIGQPTVKPGDEIEVQDLHDPRSERARIVRGHLDRGVCHLLDHE